MFCIIYVREQSIYCRLKLSLCLRQRPIELVIQKHQVHYPIVSDQRLLKVGHQVYHSCKSKRILSRGRLTLYYLRCEKI
jgi:hypothetical protein